MCVQPNAHIEAQGTMYMRVRAYVCVRVSMPGGHRTPSELASAILATAGLIGVELLLAPSAILEAKSWRAM